MLAATPPPVKLKQTETAENPTAYAESLADIVGKSAKKTQPESGCD